MRIAPVLSVLLVTALSQPVLAASGEREAQASPGTSGGTVAPTAGGGAAQGATLPTGDRQPPASSTQPRSGQSSPSRQAQPDARAPAQGSGSTAQGDAATQSQGGGTSGQGGEKSANQYAPDNTGRNRDHDRRIEAEDQSNNAADVEAVARIRRALTDDASLSLHAHNVKIIIEGGRVTLRGPVKGEAEKRKVESIVRRAAGNRQVVNELEATGR